MAKPFVASTAVEIIFLVDVSGSMAAHGKIQSLNAAMEEALPFMRSSTAQMVGVTPFVRVITFGSQVSWTASEAEPLAQFRWPPLQAEPKGMTELGAALDTITRMLDEPWRQLGPPAIILCSDGMPTDTVGPSFTDALAAFDRHPLGVGASRAAIAIGREADQESLRAFLAPVSAEPLTAQQPQQLVAQLRIAGSSVLQSASNAIW